MSAVAERSGVGKPTIYLRWANRRDLMIAAVADLRAPVATEHTGSIRADLLRCLLDDREALVAGPAARFLRSVLFEAESDDGLAQELESSVLGPRRERLVAVLARGVERGRIRAGLEPERLAGVLMAPVTAAMVVGGPEAVEPDALRAHLDVVLNGIGVDPPHPPRADRG